MAGPTVHRYLLIYVVSANICSVVCQTINRFNRVDGCIVFGPQFSRVSSGPLFVAVAVRCVKEILGAEKLTV